MMPRREMQGSHYNCVTKVQFVSCWCCTLANIVFFGFPGSVSSVLGKQKRTVQSELLLKRRVLKRAAQSAHLSSTRHDKALQKGPICLGHGVQVLCSVTSPSLSNKMFL